MGSLYPGTGSRVSLPWNIKQASSSLEARATMQSCVLAVHLAAAGNNLGVLSFPVSDSVMLPFYLCVPT